MSQYHESRQIKVDHALVAPVTRMTGLSLSALRRRFGYRPGLSRARTNRDCIGLK